MNSQAPILELQDIIASDAEMKLEVYAMKVFSGNVYHITGANGSGKSLLLQVLAHRKRADKGDILYEGKSRSKGEYSQKVLLDKIAFLQQERPFWSWGKVITYLQNAGRNKNKSAAIAWQEAMNLLEKFDLKDLADKNRRTLSGTLYKKVELLRVIMQNKDILFLDDPFAGLDESFIKQYCVFIKDMVKGDRKTVVIAYAPSLAYYRVVDLQMTISKGRIVRVEKPGGQGRSGGGRGRRSSPRPQGSERSQSSERSQRSERSQGSDRSQGSERSPRSERPQGSDRSQGSQRNQRTQ